MLKESVSSTNPLISRLQNIHSTLCDSFNTASQFYTFIKDYNNASGIRSFSVFLNQGLKAIDPNYYPLEQNHEFNIAIKALSDNPSLLEDLFNQKKYGIVKSLYNQNIVLLESLDLSYQNYLRKNAPKPIQSTLSISSSSQIIAPLYSHQSSQKQTDDFVMNDEYIYSLYSPENTFQKLDPQGREHFLEALLHLRKSTSHHLVTLLGSQDNQDLNCFLEFIDHKLKLPSVEQHYGDIAEVAKTTLGLRGSSDPEFINDECRLYRENGLNYFGSKGVPPRPKF